MKKITKEEIKKYENIKISTIMEGDFIISQDSIVDFESAIESFIDGEWSDDTYYVTLEYDEESKAGMYPRIVIYIENDEYKVLRDPKTIKKFIDRIGG